MFSISRWGTFYNESQSSVHQPQRFYLESCQLSRCTKPKDWEISSSFTPTLFLTFSFRCSTRTTTTTRWKRWRRSCWPSWASTGTRLAGPSGLSYTSECHEGGHFGGLSGPSSTTWKPLSLLSAWPPCRYLLYYWHYRNKQKNLILGHNPLSQLPPRCRIQQMEVSLKI